MKKNNLTVLIVLSMLILMACSSKQPLDSSISKPESESLIQVNPGDPIVWTMEVKYPYSITASNVPYTDDVYDEDYTWTWRIDNPANGVYNGDYYGFMDYVRWHIAYSFPSGVSSFVGNPQLQVTDNAPDRYPICLEGCKDRYPLGVISTSPSSTDFWAYSDLTYLTERITGGVHVTINKWYPRDLVGSKIGYTASGKVKKSKTGYNEGTFYIDSGVSGLNINNVTFVWDSTPNSQGFDVVLGSKWIDGTKIYFVFLETAPQ